MQGKVAIVTGAAGGIGEGIVRKLGSKGVKVIGTGRTEAKLKKLKDALGGSMEFDYIATDVTADGAPKAIVDKAIAASLGSRSMSRTKERSIFRWSIGKSLR